MFLRDTQVVCHGLFQEMADLKYLSNAEEADMRIWTHATQTSAQHILVYSPDTHIYNRGL